MVKNKKIITLIISLIIIVTPTLCMANGKAGRPTQPPTKRLPTSSSSSGTGTGSGSNPTDNWSSGFDPNDYDPSGTSVDIGADKIKDKANTIIGVIKNIGIVVSVLTLVLLGIKYMLGSLEEKAEYKKTMLPYLIGAIMVFAIPQLVQLIYNITTSTIK